MRETPEREKKRAKKIKEGTKICGEVYHILQSWERTTNIQSSWHRRSWTHKHTCTKRVTSEQETRSIFALHVKRVASKHGQLNTFSANDFKHNSSSRQLKCKHRKVQRFQNSKRNEKPEKLSVEYLIRQSRYRGLT